MLPRSLRKNAGIRHVPGQGPAWPAVLGFRVHSAETGNWTQLSSVPFRSRFGSLYPFILPFLENRSLSTAAVATTGRDGRRESTTNWKFGRCVGAFSSHQKAMMPDPSRRKEEVGMRRRCMPRCSSWLGRAGRAVSRTPRPRSPSRSIPSRAGIVAPARLSCRLARDSFEVYRLSMIKRLDRPDEGSSLSSLTFGTLLQKGRSVVVPATSSRRLVALGRATTCQAPDWPCRAVYHDGFQSSPQSASG